VRYRSPGVAEATATEPDLLVVDEAAALPVRRLAATLAAPRVVYATTVHGYEGTGRGFAVRFRDRLEEADHAVTEIRMDEPVRYAAGDPVERWAFDALLLDARPPVEPAVADATPESVRYRRLDRDALGEDRTLLRETFGLLARAHYRTEPDDLARLLDAPNVTVRALVTDPAGDSDGDGAAGHVVSVALLAREGGLSTERRATVYEGERVRGHMVPDVLTSQLRDPEAGAPVGLRVLRIATHHAVRSRGLGSRLLAGIGEEAVDGDLGEGPVDWLGTGFGATPELVRFWRENGYRAVHLSTTRNERSGEHSVLMLDPLTDPGRALTDRHARWFVDRAGAMLAGPLAAVDPDVVRAVLRSTGVTLAPDLSNRDWRVVVGSAAGPGMYAVDPGPFRRLALAHLVDPPASGGPTDRQERLLVLAVLQARPIDEVADAMGFHSVGNCLRAIGDAYRPLVDRFGGDAARQERERFEE